MADTPSSTSPSTMTPSDPPYPPKTATLGLVPLVNPDIPITAVFLILFVLGAITHMALLQVNLRRSHKFIFSGLIFGFCMARITTCVLRIAWATRPTNVSLVIAAMIFTQAGVVLLFVVNLFFTQRILRATHPRFGWHRAPSIAFKVYYATIAGALIMLITAVVVTFYTLDPSVLSKCLAIQRTGSTYFAVAAFLPLPLLFGALIIPRHQALDRFGWGSFRIRIVLLVFSTVILSLGAWFRVGTGFLPRPNSDPAWYHSRACFYCFNFLIEITVVILYAVMRVDKRFHVPDKSRKEVGYMGRQEEIERERSEEIDVEKGPKEGKKARKVGKKAEKARRKAEKKAEKARRKAEKKAGRRGKTGVLTEEELLESDPLDEKAPENDVMPRSEPAVAERGVETPIHDEMATRGETGSKPTHGTARGFGDGEGELVPPPAVEVFEKSV